MKIKIKVERKKTEIQNGIVNEKTETKEGGGFLKI